MISSPCFWSHINCTSHRKTSVNWVSAYIKLRNLHEVHVYVRINGLTVWSLPPKQLARVAFQGACPGSTPGWCIQNFFSKKFTSPLIVCYYCSSTLSCKQHSKAVALNVLFAPNVFFDPKSSLTLTSSSSLTTTAKQAPSSLSLQTPKCLQNYKSIQDVILEGLDIIFCCGKF